MDGIPDTTASSMLIESSMRETACFAMNAGEIPGICMRIGASLSKFWSSRA
jgi:hypothetical protein